MSKEDTKKLKNIMKEVDDLTAHQQNGIARRFKGEEFINHIKTLLQEIEEQILKWSSFKTTQDKSAIEYLAQARDVVRDKLKIEMLKVIIDPSEIVKERVAKKFPEGLEYDKFIAKRRAELGDKLGEALKSKEADNLRKLGLDPEEIILRGFITEEEKAIASRTFIDKTRKNPLGYIIILLLIVGLVWFLVSIFG